MGCNDHRRRAKNKQKRRSVRLLLRTSRRALALEIRRHLQCLDCGREVDIPSRFHRAAGHRKHLHCRGCNRVTQHIELEPPANDRQEQGRG